MTVASHAVGQSKKNQKSNVDPDTGLRKDAETVAKTKFSRQAEEAFRAATATIANDQEMEEPARLLAWVQAGKWSELGKFLQLFEPEGGRRLHNKICSDLSYATPKSTMLPQDVIALADASPVELDDRQITHLGSLLKLALRESESRTEVLAQLQKGTERLGGTDSHRRRMAARMLFAAELQAEARTFGLPEREIRPGAIVEPEPESETPVAPTKRTSDQLLTVLRDQTSDATAQATALSELHDLLIAATPATADKLLGTIVDDAKHPELVKTIVGMIGQKTAAAGRDIDYNARTIHLELQHRAIQILAKKNKLTDEPWSTVANLSANSWLLEANNSVKVYPTWLKSPSSRDKNPHVAIETVIAHAPADQWLAALQSPLNSMVRIALARTILLSDNIDRALPVIREVVPADGPAAAKLANAYLENWARRHDPNLSAEVMKQYRVDNQVIVLTRAQQEESLKQLGALLTSLDEPTRKLLDEAQLVRAFDFCHSRAEIYTQASLVEVFGPLEKISPTMMLTLTERTRNKLSTQWRDLSVQRDAATKRNSADVFQLVNRGYDEAVRTAEKWLELHQDDWRMNSTVGSLLSDWAEFAYFQSVAADDNGDRFASYLKHSQQALNRFRAGAQAYAATVPKLKRNEFDLLPYRSWFYGLLGITHDGGVNLRKGITRDSIEEIRRAMSELPGGASAAHIQLFSTMVADNITANRIAPEMKYRYLSSAVQITGRQPTIYPAEEKIKYYDSLLKEIRLQTRLDGSDQIHSPGIFGVFVTLAHTVDVARESGGFSKYLMNEVQRTVSGKTITEKPLYRDRFEESLRVALADFFEVRSITFADPASGARDIESPSGTKWQETPMAYLLLATKDKTVDRVPALEIELDFFDRDGKVVIPVPSNPIQIEMKPDASPKRPVKNVSLTQIVDSRELADKRLKIDVIASAHGLIPELDELLNLSGYSLSVQEVAEKEGLLVRELHNGADGLYAVTERSWTVHLDPAPLLRGASSRVDFEFPKAKSTATQMTYRRYQDLDPVEAAAQVTLMEGTEVAKVAEPNYRHWIGVALSILTLLVLAIVLFRKPTTDTTTAPPLFTLPQELTPFSVISLLHRIQASKNVTLDDDKRRALQNDIRSLEQKAFARESNQTSADDLQSIAKRWLMAVGS